jgi:CYTH domain-containing protein
VFPSEQKWLLSHQELEKTYDHSAAIMRQNTVKLTETIRILEEKEQLHLKEIAAAQQEFSHSLPHNQKQSLISRSSGHRSKSNEAK